MRKNSLFAVCLFAFAAISAIAQSRPAYLEVSKAQVRGDKSKEYDDAIHKLIDVNRKYKGDHWIALTTEYGDTGTYLFSSSRDTLASVETGGEAFMKALKEGLGPMADKLMRDLGAWSTFRSEMRRRRWDLSVHPPADAAAMADLIGHSRWIRTLRLDMKPGGTDPARMSDQIGHSRWIRTLRLDMKPGRALDYVEAWKGFQTELESISPPVTALVSESITGTPAMYVGLYYKSMADMDKEAAAVQPALSSAAYMNLAKATAGAIDKTNWEIHRVRPDLSNPPDEVLNADPAFWKPKPMAAPAKPKTDTTAEKK